MSKDYIRPMDKKWWTTRPGWSGFMWREWTALPIAIYCGVLLVMAAKLDSPESFAGFFAWLKTPTSILIHAVVLIFAVWHTVTWFAAAPKALRVFRGESQVAPGLIAGGHFAAWVVVSAAFTWLVVGW
ncbi:MAG: hypothetical protein O2894_01715 [Planctomycetota bacterium]|nr:hypothetical protein [Planctomycetota bacterium]